MKIKLFGSALIALALVFLTAVPFGGATEVTSVGKFFDFGKKIVENKNKTENIGTINGVKINPKDVYDQQAFLEIINGEQPVIAKQKAIEQVVEDTLLFNEAQKRNLVITLDEAKAFAKTQREMLEKNRQSSNPEEVKNAEEVSKMIAKLIQGLKITEEEYWNQYVLQGYLKYNSIAKLRAEITKDAKTDKDAQDTWKNFVSELKKSAKIELNK